MPKMYTFICSPYSSGLRPEVKEQEALRTQALAGRFNQVLEFTAWCVRQNHTPFSPIVHCHEMAQRYSLPKDAKFWQEYNEIMLSFAGRVFVLGIDGWDRSEGVMMERVLAHELGIPVALATYNPGIEVHDKNRYTLEPLPL